ncbi:MAG: protease HtpX [Oligoflexia bacterium]|nr:protease HtpX [Oligoflexia bacterium]
MAWVKRIFVFVAVNLLVMATISILLKVFGVQPYLTARGIDYQALLAFCLIWGMGGAFISLALSRMMAKWMMGVQVIPPDTRDPELQDLVERVHALSRSAGLPRMPEVGIYESPEVNAFATGPTKSRALVAVSTGLLHRMRADEVDGVLGHEVAHIANGDMVTMTLIQGVVNAFAMFLARVIAYAISMATTRDDREEGASTGGFAYHMTVFVLEIVFMMLGSIVVAWFSRQREYRADKGGARLAGRDKMVSALQALRRTYEAVDTEAQPAVQTLKISGKGTGIYRLFSTHPPLVDRLERLLSAS